MQFTSTALIFWVAFVSLTAGFVAGRYWPRDEPDESLAYAREHLARLAVAQHWARAGILSETNEPWRPVCTALAIASLALENATDLSRALTAMHEASADDPELANVWGAAISELANSRREVSPQFFPGDWPIGHTSQLRLRAAECLQNAQLGARAVLHARRGQSLVSDASKVDQA